MIFNWFISDINELTLPKTCATEFPDPDDLLNFKLIICPDEGFYKGGRFVFNFRVGPNYPHEPPKVKCETQVYHPNIDLEGNVCLNILREDWNPVLTISSIVYGLQYLFLVSLITIRMYVCIFETLFLFIYSRSQILRILWIKKPPMSCKQIAVYLSIMCQKQCVVILLVKHILNAASSDIENQRFLL